MHRDCVRKEGLHKLNNLFCKFAVLKRVVEGIIFRKRAYVSVQEDWASVATKQFPTVVNCEKKFSKLMKRCSIFILITMFFLIGLQTSFAAKIVELNIKGPIGPATADYLERGIKSAQYADLIVILIDTPGGLYDSTRNIIQLFLLSDVPIVTYVSPTGARAASAGTYLMYASTLAAMAPGTQMGAASPVSLGTGFSEDEKEEKKSTMETKVTHDAVATIRSLAQLRGRDPDFAEKAVTEGKSITANEALSKGVVNYIAKNRDDLLSQIHGIKVSQNNKIITINTESPDIQVINPDWRTRFLSVITNPTVAYLLLLLGIYGIFFELVNPGYVLPGVVGAVSMLFALYALQLLPINYAGLGLIILGILFVIAEAFTPSFGALGVGGTVSFILGSIMLMNTEHLVFQIAWSAIWAMAVLNILIFVLVLGMLIKSRNQKIRHGLETLVGAKGRALGDINLEGQAVIKGEIWNVHARSPIAANKSIKVTRASGLLLEVEEDQSVY
ncbi:TPA: nodulation protein NfeD [Legionella pneumophila subsp. pneumophila]|uniref:NfeD family protein n=1 Tax=Legionella pneumophila TaxID=446 RepID=UPI0007709139|nr:nodulation protein NfeD [Legionella pneumophila]HAT9214682.1 nodulation protein NfeD [Legionella pneumophila subsp. pneumophila]CZI38160.1 NfeD-like C-terminal%2C partner-binding [Legionella pneumophila]HAT9262136.1 nodulation protein NfeD [Legionella pneumophila subsp. pneumophila]HAT9282554.1 nodulation protein NfeD [Legionella pneumophila subsp. pneumophila]HAT9288486.1 nodulation protein NfeD [Legionella pneumophila subsp. pneumophila]